MSAGEAVDFAALAKERALRQRTQSAQPKAAGVGTAPAQSKVSSSTSGVTSAQKALLVLAAVLVGPAVLKQVYDKMTAETVDLSNFNIVTNYDTPAIDMMDDTVRIQFCAN